MIGIIGSGSWATAIIKILLEKADREIVWWVRRAEMREALQRDSRNPSHLQEVELDMSRIHLSGDVDEVAAKCDVIILAIPSAHVATVLGYCPAEAFAGRRFVSAVKGAVPDTANTVSQYLEHELAIPAKNICVISGPTHAEEVCMGRPTFLTVASVNQRFAAEVKEMLSCSYMHLYCIGDIAGVEITGLMKNIYAIGAGLCQGTGYGDNLTAVYVATAYRELRRLLEHYLPDPQRDPAQQCYLGDLMVTCWSQHSRNRRLGMLLGQGVSLYDAVKQIGIVPEGYYSARIAHEHLTSEHACTPLCDAVYRILYEGSTPQVELERVINNSL